VANGDTVVAQSTPYGYGGIGVVRVTGPSAVKILGRLSGMSKNKLRTIKPRKVYKRSILDENNNPFDDVVVTLYKKPKSYTGEDVLEISCHGSPYIMKYIIDLCINYGASPAGPGEFTKRAFINGKIDLMQAESVANMVSASSHRGVNIALNGLRGSLSKEIGVMREELVDILSYSEHLLDVSEEDLTHVDVSYIIDKTAKTQKILENLMKTYNTCRIMTSGAIVVLAGPTNSGKSTLFNSLAGYDRAIVNQAPGTTRDLLEAMVIIEGVPITVVDTAGVRVPADSVESEGIRRAKEHMKKADITCMVQDITRVNMSSEDADNILLKKNRCVFIFNKIDLIKKGLLNKYRENFKGALFTSALNGLGLEELKKHILSVLDLKNNDSESFGITTPRQYNAIIKSNTAMLKVKNMINQNPIQLELISYELQSALRGIEELLGIKTTDEILDNMFNSFCVGK
jgi:tRNA modification GTPase